MFCSQCGAQIADDAKFCGKCGSQIKNVNEEQTIPEQETDIQTDAQENIAQEDSQQDTNEPEQPVDNAIENKEEEIIPAVDLTQEPPAQQKKDDEGPFANKKMLMMAGGALACFVLLLIIFGSGSDTTSNSNSLINNEFIQAQEFIRRGNDCRSKKDYDNAIINYTKAIELDPTYGFAYDNRAMAYYEKKDYANAIKAYSQIIELKLGGGGKIYGYDYSKRGDVYMALGNYREAISDYKKALEIDPDNQSAKESLQKLEQRQAQQKQKQDEERQRQKQDEQRRQQLAEQQRRQQEQQQVRNDLPFEFYDWEVKKWNNYQIRVYCKMRNLTNVKQVITNRFIARKPGQPTVQMSRGQFRLAIKPLDMDYYPSLPPYDLYPGDSVYVQMTFHLGTANVQNLNGWTVYFETLSGEIVPVCNITG